MTTKTEDKATTAQHTPSPWYQDGSSIMAQWETTSVQVCGMFTTTFAGVDSHHNARMRRETVANARLIAAAPELLQLIGEINCWLVSPDLSPGVLAAYKHDCEIAIAKATGK